MFNNQNGFSLISTTIAMSMVGVMAASMGSIFQMQAKGNKNTEFKMDFQSLRSQINSVLSEQATCDSAFEKLDGSAAKFTTAGTSVDLDRIVKHVGGTAVLIAEEGREISPGQEVERIWLEYQKDLSGAPVPSQIDTPAPGQATHHVELNLKVSRTNSLGGSEAYLPPVKLTLITNAISDEIQACDGLGGAAAATGEEEWVTYSVGGGLCIQWGPYDNISETTQCNMWGNNTSQSPLQACQAAGYTTFIGPCKVTNTSSGVVSALGTIYSKYNAWTGVWSVSCSNSSASSTNQLELLCK